MASCRLFGRHCSFLLRVPLSLQRRPLRGFSSCSLQTGLATRRCSAGSDSLLHSFHKGTAWSGQSASRTSQMQTRAGTKSAPTQEVAFFPERYPDIKLDSSDALSTSADLLVLAISREAFGGSDDEGATDSSNEDQPKFNGMLGENVSDELKGLLEALSASNQFKGEKGSVAVGVWLGGSAKVIALVGLGKDSAADENKLCNAMRDAGQQLAATAKSTKSKTARFALYDTKAQIQGPALRALANGILLGGYEATRFKAKAPISALEQVLVHGAAPGSEEQVHAGVALAKGTLLARYLVEAPPNICTPTHIANAAVQIKDAAPDVFSLEVLEEAQCREMGMGLYLGVSECSSEPPKFVHLTYKSPQEGAHKVVGLIGKGLTFDSGGYNLKVGGMIEMMKFDMGGAGAILGAAHAIGFLKPPGLEIHFITASCENMIAGHGMRPGDILTAANGKTVEVNNTDAEGRLTLADALWFAQEKCSVTKVVDVATLTGACMVALGNEVAGLFTPSKNLEDNLVAASGIAGEKIWPMPMHDSYWSQMKSPIADMKNTGGRMGGAITAALFLKQYVDTKKVEWAHIDIAGPAWDEKQGQATGFGAALLAEWAMEEGSNTQS